MNFVSVVHSGNQTKLPKAIVNALGIKPRTKLIFELNPAGHVMLSAKTRTFASLAGELKKTRQSVAATDEQIQSAIRKGAANRFRQSKA